MNLEQLKEQYERDPENFQAFHMTRIGQHISDLSDSALVEARLQRFLWSTVARLRNFVGHETHYWYLLYNTLNQRAERLRLGFDRIKIHPTNNVVNLDEHRRQGPFAKKNVKT